MIRSMTGFTTRSVMLSLRDMKVPLSFSIKSLNARYFDTNCKLPYPINNLETEFIKLFKEKLLRGTITFTIHVGNPNAFKGAIEPSISTLNNYFKALETIKRTFAVEGTLSIANVLMLPNIFVTEEVELDEHSKSIIFSTTKELVNELIISQAKEGNVLKKDIQNRIAIMSEQIEFIEKAFEKVMVTQKQKINTAMISLEQDNSKFAEIQKDSLYAILDKLDVNEEIVRFKNHLKNLDSYLESAEIEKGKRIDFTLQELSREINTITAKCADTIISAHAINIKVEIEKAREQTQNII